MTAVLSFVDTRSRGTDGDTSREAAKAAVSRKADRERAQIIAAIKEFGPLTAREVSTWTCIDYHTVQRRISETGLIKTDQSRDGCRIWSA